MKDLLKFLTCGSVDDGKSTLIGRLLSDANLLFQDQKEALKTNSYADLLDGLMAEREQGITIDVAYRYFTTENRSFIVADTPGHEQYTRNMAVGASFASLAVLLIDVTYGDLKVQTYRHARICRMMGIDYFVFALNKMDKVDYAEDCYLSFKNKVQALCEELQISHACILPIAAKKGDNVVFASHNMPWYKGPTLLSYLEQVDVQEDKNLEGTILPIQRVCRPNSSYRGYQGELMRGSLAVGDEVYLLPTKERCHITSILWGDKQVQEACVHMPISIELDKDIDASRGNVFVKDIRVGISDHFEAKLIWMAEEQLSITKSYYLKLSTQVIPVQISSVLYQEDVETGIHKTNVNIGKNDIAGVEISASQKVILTEFEKEALMGRFLLIDRITNETVAGGIVLNAHSVGNNLVWQETDITKELRATSLKQKPITIWMTGLSGAGKSALANALEKKLYALNKHTMLLDGDNIRMGLNKDLKFKEADRSENIRRIAEVAKLMNDAGLIVMTAFISPFEEDRQLARDIIGQDAFYEVYVSTPLEVCEARDVKGLYQKARLGNISNFTGISSPYEVPENPNYTMNMSEGSIEAAADLLLEELVKKGLI